MPPRSSKTVKDYDFATTARRAVEKAIGEKLDGTPLDDPIAGKNLSAVALGKLGGVKGGKARAEALSPRKRKQIAKKAPEARWGKKGKVEPLDLRCPKCGSSKAVAILYGLPSPDAPPIDRSKYVLGGCIVEFENTLCDSCGHRWEIDRAFSV